MGFIRNSFANTRFRTILNPFVGNFSPFSTCEMGICGPHAFGQFGIDPYVEAAFAERECPAAADETVGLEEGEDGARESVPEQQLRAAFGSLARFEQGSIDENIEAPRRSAPASTALRMASCSAWCVAEVSCV